MLPKRKSAVQLLIAGVCIAAGACTERTAPTAVPVAANTALVGVLSPNNEKVKVKMFQLSANTLRINGPAVVALVSIDNSGPAIPTGVSLLAEITQGTATRRAATLPTQCSPTLGNTGKLPPGPCDMTFDAVASNAAPGSGTLISGSATFTLHVMRAGGGGDVELANKSILVNLVATPSITTLTLAPTTLVIDGLTPANYTASLQNPANSLQGVLLQGWIVQGTTKRAAGGTLVGCGSATGVLPPGPCAMSFSASASSSGAGTGTLVPGAATFQLDLIQNSGGVSTTFDAKTVAVTLVSNSPKITSLALTSPVIVINGPSDNYTAKLQNPGLPVSDVLLQGELVQVQGASTITVAAAGTLVDCGAGLGVLPTTGGGTCTIQFVATASTTAAGNGTLVPGPATFVLHLYTVPVGGPQTELDVRTVAVGLTQPGPTIVNIAPVSTSAVLDGSGPFTEYTATIQNPGVDRSLVLIQGWIRQGTARRAAGGGDVTCGPEIGVLPNGSCQEFGSIVASNATSGTGTLVPGAATFELELRLFNGVTTTVLDTKSILITLTAP